MTILPMITMLTIESIVSQNRLQQLFDQEESLPIEKANNHDFPIVIEHGNFEWEVEKKKKKLRKPLFSKKQDTVNTADAIPLNASQQQAPVGTLTDINVKIPHGKLIIIVGGVGSGKSSLLNAIIGEMRKVSGSVQVSGSLCFCSQQAWIQNASLRDNILFGMPFDNAKYERVLQVCALKKDLEILQGGDLTEIGEKGINLSGGQRQRVSLARAVYTDRDVYLLDDILSAVDTHVGRWIFEKCVMEHLQGKTRVFVTHQLQYVKHADHVIVFDHGKIAEQGTYQELMSNSEGLLHRQVSEFLVKEEQKQVEEAAILKAKQQAAEKTSTTASQPASQPTPSVDKLIAEEERVKGKANLRVLLQYMWKMGGPLVVLFLLCMFVLAQSGLVAADIWLSLWSGGGVITTLSTGQSMAIYGGMGAVGILAVFVRDVSLSMFGLLAAYRLHRDMFKRIIRAPMAFFDVCKDIR